jgi:microcystin-dependent protein
MIILSGDHERSPDEIRAANQITRREVLRRVAFGSGALLIPGLLAACVDENFNPLASDKDEDESKRELSAFGASDAFLSEIKLVSFNFPPKGWALCNGQFLPINQNQALFALLGTTYGGNGQTNFALPNLRGRVPIHFDGGHTLGEAAGSTSVTVNAQQLPTHTHALLASTTDGDTPVPSGTVLAATPAKIYGPAASLTTLNPLNVTNVGGSQPHNNMMPYLTLNFIIALQGIFPSRN